MVGRGLWSETFNDLVVETMQQIMDLLLAKVTPWKILELVPVPEDSEQILEDVRNELLKNLNYIKSIADKKGKKYVLCDKVS